MRKASTTKRVRGVYEAGAPAEVTTTSADTSTSRPPFAEPGHNAEEPAGDLQPVAAIAYFEANLCWICADRS